jgi:hypothetical protein
MTFRSALTSLAGLTVPGVIRNYDIDAVPDDLSRVQLPALLVLPARQQQQRQQQGAGFEALAFSAGARTVTYSLDHLLLVAPLDSGRGSRSHLPALIDLIDAYFTALGADVTLSGALLEPARVRVEPGIFSYGHAKYHGVAFQHTWIIQI